MSDDRVLGIITIFRFPLDHPSSYVVRRFWVRSDGKDPEPEAEPIAVVPTLREARMSLPVGLAMIPRASDDHETVVESWL